MVKVDEGDPKYGPLEAPYTKLYSFGTSNGKKIFILLRLLGKEDYFYRPMDMEVEMEQKQSWFIKLNPNGRFPVLSEVDSNGKQIILHETGVISQWIADKYDVERKYSYNHDDPLWWEQSQWLTFQVASHSPIQGQTHHFQSFSDVDDEYGKKRFQDELKRIYDVYEKRLTINNGWLVGDHLNIADINAFPWVSRCEFAKISLDEFPILKKWHDKIAAIPEVQEAMLI
ncbi:putative glutathione S-transferase [Wickerhamomyces ciferrii]|uniref:Glutathione S-transferase n=1 Tax=Wickerhamomyces ciferrii (strain ATCC 14091 / BCRC 22168 / CBS 111 / JCM 3599 / NBRC 0793 / NRRL Y-1031 F-60-10) TaxID=1206466 RepID=K0K8R2_WICCF|nr:putative glutathione S-transferase [Wickerhamomyces ciferrii]CCH41230.1 putative glutathione S-transferase [Wickerhamomyces ciferrii]